MGWKVKTGPTVEPVTLAEAKLHLKVDSDTTDDTLIAALITAAREQAEKATGRVFIEQEIEWKFEEFECEDEIELPVGPVISVSSITYTDANNTTQTLSTSVYDVDKYSEPGSIFLKWGQIWPLSLDIENAICVTFKAGYGATAAYVPGSIKAAILLIIGHLYQNREDVVVGRTPSELPMGATHLLTFYKLFNI